MSLGLDSALEGARTRESIRDVSQGALLGIVTLATTLRGYALDGHSLWIDETFSWHTVTTRPMSEILLQVPVEDPHPPLYYALLDGWVTVFGDSVAAMRSMSVVFGVAAVYLVFATGRVLFDRRVGLVAALLLSVSPMHVQFSREARMYSLLVFLTLLSFYFLARTFQGQRSRAVGVGYVVATLLLLYTHVYALFVVFVQGALLSHWVVSGRLPSVGSARTWLGRFAVVGVGALPWMAVLLGKVFGGSATLDHIDPPTVGLALRALLSHGGALLVYPFAYEEPVSITASILVLVVGLVLVWRSFVGYRPDEGTDREFRHYLRREYLLLAWFLVPIALPYVASHLAVPMFNARYTILAQGALWVLVAHGVTRLDRSPVRWLCIGVLVTGLLTASVVAVAGDTQEDWSGAAVAVDEQPSAPVFVAPEFDATANSLAYYAERPPATITFVPSRAVETANDPLTAPNETVAEIRRELRRTPGDTGRFYVVSLFAAAENVVADLRTDATEIDRRSYGSVDVYLFDVAGSGGDERTVETVNPRIRPTTDQRVTTGP